MTILLNSAAILFNMYFDLKTVIGKYYNNYIVYLITTITIHLLVICLIQKRKKGSLV